MFRFENKSSSWVKIKMKIKGPAYFRQQYPGPRSFSLNFSPRERKRISMNIVARDSIVLRDTCKQFPSLKKKSKYTSRTAVRDILNVPFATLFLTLRKNLQEKPMGSGYDNSCSKSLCKVESSMSG